MLIFSQYLQSILLYVFQYFLHSEQGLTTLLFSTKLSQILGLSSITISKSEAFSFIQSALVCPWVSLSKGISFKVPIIPFFTCSFISLFITDFALSVSQLLLRLNFARLILLLFSGKMFRLFQPLIVPKLPLLLNLFPYLIRYFLFLILILIL